MIPTYKETTIRHSATPFLLLSVNPVQKTPGNTAINYFATINDQDYKLSTDQIEVEVIPGDVEIKLRAELIQDGILSPSLTPPIRLETENKGHVSDCIETKYGGLHFEIPLQDNSTLSFWACCNKNVFNYGDLNLQGSGQWEYISLIREANNVLKVYSNLELVFNSQYITTDPVILGAEGECRLNDLIYDPVVIDLSEIEKHIKEMKPFYDPRTLSNLDESLTIHSGGLRFQCGDSLFDANSREGRIYTKNMRIEGNYVPGQSGYLFDDTTGDVEINNLTARGNILAGTRIAGQIVDEDSKFTDTIQEESWITSTLKSKGLDAETEDSTIVADNLIVKNGLIQCGIDTGPLFMSKTNVQTTEKNFATTDTVKNVLDYFSTTLGIVKKASLEGSINGYDFNSIEITKETEDRESGYLYKSESVYVGHNLNYPGDAESKAPSWWNTYPENKRHHKYSTKQYFYYGHKEWTYYKYHCYFAKFYLNNYLVTEIDDTKVYPVRVDTQTTASDAASSIVSPPVPLYKALNQSLKINPKDNPWTILFNNWPSSANYDDLPPGAPYYDINNWSIKLKPYF